MSTEREGSITPQARRLEKQTDSEEMLNILGSMTNTLNTIGRNFVELDEHSAKLGGLKSTKIDTLQEIQALRGRLQKHEQEQKNGMAELKARLTGEIKRQVFMTAINHVKQQVPIEIRRQTEREVEAQIREYIPIPLQQQAIENKQQLAEMKASLANSKSRIRNESLDMASQDEPLTPIYLPDGTKSKYFPADLRSLLAYDPQSMKKVLNDYGLMEDEDHEINLQRFLSYVGVNSDVVISRKVIYK